MHLFLATDLVPGQLYAEDTEEIKIERIKVSEISRHTQTNIWVMEQFFGKIFKIEGNIIEVEKTPLI
jgi:RNA 3'-terminal phosphate cyclase